MIKLIDFKPRLYQESIFETVKDNNTLVVLPTGLGKTAISMLLTISRLNKFEDSKALLISPTKPLCGQHIKSFIKYTDIKIKDILLYTGEIPPEKRKEIWKDPKLIIATPQTIQNDLIKNRLILKDFSCLTIDEAHRSRMKYSNTLVAKKYISQSKYPRVLALTASPGGTRNKIKEICDNLFIEKVEIRTEEDEDVKQYIQKREIEWIKVKLSNEILQIKSLLSASYKDKLTKLKGLGLSKPINLINKRDLLSFQQHLRREINSGNKSAFYGISLVAQAIKIGHAIELLETQTLKTSMNFLNKLMGEETKAAKIINAEPKVKLAKIKIEKLIEDNKLHPKLLKLKEIISKNSTKDAKIIIFANFRGTVKNIVSELNNIKGINAIQLMGQKEGITQKQQLSAIKEFEQGIYNVLVGTSVSEEGLDISGATMAIFYDNVPSEIRKVQRMGRVARLQSGKIIFLMAEKTRDEAYYWSSIRKEKVMKSTLKNYNQKNLKSY